jgi:hypothetical protein
VIFERVAVEDEGRGKKEKGHEYIELIEQGNINQHLFYLVCTVHSVSSMRKYQINILDYFHVI